MAPLDSPRRLAHPSNWKHYGHKHEVCQKVILFTCVLLVRDTVDNRQFTGPVTTLRLGNTSRRWHQQL